MSAFHGYFDGYYEHILTLFVNTGTGQTDGGGNVMVVDEANSLHDSDQSAGNDVTTEPVYSVPDYCLPASSTAQTELFGETTQNEAYRVQDPIRNRQAMESSGIIKQISYCHCNGSIF